MKTSKFQQIISSAVSRVKPVLSPSQLQAFDQMLNALPKRIKEFNAEPYLFIFQSMLRRKELVEPALAAFATMLEENYITSVMYDRLAGSLAPLMRDHAYAAVQTILRIKEPHLDFLRLYFEVHSTVALPEDILRKFKAVGYGWLARAFAMTLRDLPQFQAGVYAKFYPEEMPRLAKPEEQEREVRRYVGLVLGHAVEAVEERLEGGRGNRGKYGFCFLCKQPADYYCKDTKAPVCSVDCKKAHLEMLAKSNSLNGHYSESFLLAIEQLLVSNLQRRVSPALSIDFLIAIYSFSSYSPQCPLPHSRILLLPVIYERIWMLYLSYYGKREELCEHILASCLTAQDQFVRHMATEYFLKLAADPRFLRVYAAFDAGEGGRLTDVLLRSLEDSRRGEFIQALVGTLFNAYERTNQLCDHSELGLVRAFNHQKDLSPSTLALLFGEDSQRKLIRLILRNELAINRQKLGEFLYSNQELLRIFLGEVARMKSGAPIDELLREIFYFINVKISDKIYRLFEILSEVYQPQPPFDVTSFFTYAYFVIMVVTELNNPAVTNKPTLPSVLSRVEQFYPALAKQNPEIVQGMFERISIYPFSQASRGLLSHYPSVKAVGGRLPAESVVVENNELIYEVVIACVPDVLLLYRICCLTANHPAITQVFLQLLVDKLQEEPRDPFLVQAVSLVVERQPNAAGCLWREILEDRPVMGEASFSVQQLVQASQHLTDGNFKQFVRELCQACPLTSSGEHYITLLSLNRQRTALIVPLLVANYDKCSNLYLKIAFIKRLGKFLEGFSDQSLLGFLRRMLEDLPVLPITEGLLVQGVAGVRMGSQGEDWWRAVGKKCLEMRSERAVEILEGFLKMGGDELYESYLIQKTLNCCKKQHISSEILKNLKKLQPYINQIRPDLLRMFVIEQNLQVIMRFFGCFSRFNATYQILLEKWKADPQWIDAEKVEIIIKNVQGVLSGEDAQREMLPLFNVPKVIAKLVGKSGFEAHPLLQKYLKIIQFKQPEEPNCFPQENAMLVVHFNILAQHFHQLVTEIVPLYKQGSERMAERREELSALAEFLLKMHETARNFQTNIPLRFEIRKLLRMAKPQIPLPSLLTSSILLQKAVYAIQDFLVHPNEPSLMRLLHATEEVIAIQGQLASSLSPAFKKDSPERVAVVEASREAMRYGEMAIESVYQYLQVKGELSTQDRATMKGILISILIQGCFNEETGSFQSLAGSQLAEKVEQIFYLLR